MFTGLNGSLLFQECEAYSISGQSAHEGVKVVSPGTGRLIPPGDIPGTHCCYRLSRPQDQSAAGRIIIVGITIIYLSIANELDILQVIIFPN